MEQIQYFKLSSSLALGIEYTQRGNILSLVELFDKNHRSIEPDTELYTAMNRFATSANELILHMGSRFQQSVWLATCQVPFATTASYKQIAVAIGKPNAYRAVANALHANPFAPFIPCHRIVHSSGITDGYAFGNKVKKMLLEWEMHYNAKEHYHIIKGGSL